MLIQAPSLGCAINNDSEQTMAMFHVTDDEFNKWRKLYANTESTNCDIKYNTVPGNVLTQISNLVSSHSSESYTQTESDHLYYNKTSVYSWFNALNADNTDLMTTSTNLQNNITTNMNAIAKVSSDVAVSTTVPEVYLHIPDTSFIGVRTSDHTNSMCVLLIPVLQWTRQ